MARAGLLSLCVFALLHVPLQAQDANSGPAVQAFIFSDVLYSDTEGAGSKGFQVGQVVGHGNVLLSNHVALFGEVSVSSHDTGYTIEMERAIIRYDFSDALKISAGRYHTPISYWNTAYHHGLWLQGSVARPEAVKFGSRFIPVHFVGAMAEGRVPNAPVVYHVGIGNGRAGNIARAGDAGDINAERAVVASVAIQPSSLLGFQVGGALYLDNVPAVSGPDARERITNANFVWDRGGLQVISEYIHIRHEAPGSGAATASHAAYVHAGVRLRGALHAFMPYARWEKTTIADGDVVFTGLLPDYRAVLGGIRWDFADLAALKAEYRDQRVADADAVGTLYLQASFAVPLFAR